MAEDMLFATLDPTMRQITLPSGRTAILSDTVGFISALPTQLVAAFRATLEEVLEADLVIHVRDIASKESEAQKVDVHGVLRDLGLGDEDIAGMIQVLNKTDMLTPDRHSAVQNRAARNDNMVPLSAVKGQGTDALLALIEQRLFPAKWALSLHFAHRQGRAVAWLYDHGAVRDRADDEDGARLDLEMTDREFFQFRKLLPDCAPEPAGELSVE